MTERMRDNPENNQDRANQTKAVDAIRAHMMKFPIQGITIEETPKEKLLPFDARVYVAGMYVGMIEIKCSTYTIQQCVRAVGGLLIESPQLKRQAKQAFVKGHGWTKSVIIAYLMSDDRLFFLNIKDIVDHWAGFDDAPDGLIKDNHGETEADRKGKIVPAKYWTEII